MLPVRISDIHALGVSPDMVNPAPVRFNSLAQGVPFRGLETGVNPSDDTVERTVNAPVSLLQEPHELHDSSYLNVSTFVIPIIRVQKNSSINR